MLMTQKQCAYILENFDKIKSLLEIHHLSCIRMFEPQFIEQQDKINILANGTEEHDYFTLARINVKLNQIIRGVGQINLVLEEDLEEHLKEFIINNTYEFSKENLASLYPSEKPYEIKTLETSEVVEIKITLRKNPASPLNPLDLLSDVKQETEKGLTRCVLASTPQAGKVI